MNPPPSRPLRPGDVIAIGTPAGVGASKGLFPKAGDTVEVEVDGRSVSNPVRGEWVDDDFDIRRTTM
jgi:2-keto-4-pentenoate hydratase/2-oxohepta-3-ene-1,7-dioic acid hydratase in catechol pathway